MNEINKSSIYIISILALLVLMMGNVSGMSEWNNTFGGSSTDLGQSVSQTSDGGYIITGYYDFDDTGRDLCLIKTNSTGEKEWSSFFGGTEDTDDWGFSVVQTPDGGYIITGYTVSYGNGKQDAWLIKTDPSGIEEWNRTYGGDENDYGKSVIITSDGGYAITGETKSYSGSTYEGWLIKTNSSGDIEWIRTYDNSPKDDRLGSVRQTSDGGYIMVGYSYYNATKFDIWLLKTDQNGIKEWNNTFGGDGTGRDQAWSVKQISDDCYVIAGGTASYGAGSNDAWLIKTGPNGDEVWNQTYGGSGTDKGYFLDITDDEGYIITGETKSYGAGDYDAWLIRTDSDGNEQWNMTFGASDSDKARSVRQTADGGYIIAGSTKSYGTGGYDVWLIKTFDPVPKPDLEITQKSEHWIDMGNKIYEITYTVANNGDVTTDVSTTSIQIDGTEVITDAVPELNDGEQHTSTLGPFTMSDNSDTINICADKDDTVDESNEANNCLENVFGSFSNNVYFTPDGSSAEYAGTATVEVYADTTDEFQGGQFYLDFGESCANITDLTFDSTWIYTSKNFADYPGAVFASFRKDPPMVNGLQHICTLTIQCDNPDYCMGDLHFAFVGEAPSGKDTKLFDDSGNVLADQGWHDGTFTCMNLPDLVITEEYGEQQTGDDYIVHYTVSNEGNAQAQSGHISSLSIDGTFVENKEVPDALAPGESYSGTFDTVLTMTMPNDLMMVCCDTNSNEMELDEANNCMESFYPAGIEIKVDVQDGGECFDMGEQFLVNIDVDPRNIPVYGVQYTLSFNNSALHAEWQNEGTFLNSDGATTAVVINTIDNGAGTISFAATRTYVQTGVTVPGTLAVIKFTAILQGGSSDLNLSDVIASNVNGDEILPLDLIEDNACIFENMAPVAIGKSMHEYNNDGTKYLCTSYFNGTESNDPDGEVIYWRWSFGDGEYATGESVEHVYRSWRWIGENSTGHYEPFNVSLTVTDDGDPHELANTMEFDVNVYIAGDANGDGKVNILDATIIGLEWGEITTCGAYCWDGNDRGDKADLNNDKKVNILDAVIIGTCWGHTAWEG